MLLSFHVPSDRDFVQADILDRSPDNRQATGLRCEHINLIRALPYIAKQAFNGIRCLNMPMHALRKIVKREGALFLLSQAAHRFWIAFAILRFEGCQMGQCFLLQPL